MQNTLDRNFGTKKSRGRENRRIARDKKIDRLVRSFKSRSILLHRIGRVPLEPFSPYMGIDAPQGEKKRTKFPMRRQHNGKPLPQFKDLSRWFKFDLLAMAMYEYAFVKFDVHVHPKLEQQWIDEHRDPRKELGERTRKELHKLSCCPGKGWEYAFVVEGWAKQSQRSRDWSNPKQVGLHIHGFAAHYDGTDLLALKVALERACGHGLRGYPKLNPKTHLRQFDREGQTFPNYLFKYSRRKDERLGFRRDFISNAGLAFAEDFWNLISDRDDDFWKARSLQ